MARYKVIALSVGGKNKVYDSGDLVDETNFPDGNIAALIDQGFIAPHVEDVADLPVDLGDVIGGLGANTGETDPADEGGADGVDTSEEEAEEDADEADTESDAGGFEAFDKITTKKVKKLLKEKGITFDQNASKQSLYDLLIGK